MSKVTKEQAIQRVIDIAEGQIGYLEKASNKDLNSKTGNAGYNNYTKYWADIYPQFQGQPWCACFVSWCFKKAFGLEIAKKLLKHWPYTYCPALASYTTNHTPKKGSVITFYRNGTYTHTGIVIDVVGTRITTIEGNTSGASGIVANGGGVCKKVYDTHTLSGNTKYFIPDYSIVDGVTADKEPTKDTTAPVTPVTQSTVKAITATGPATKFDKAVAGTYVVTASELNIRNGGGTVYKILGAIPRGTKVQCFGYYTPFDGVKWLYIQVEYSGVLYTGFCSGEYLKKV